MTDQLKQLIEELSLRIRLFIETTGRGIGDEALSERDLNFLEYLNEKGGPGFSEISAFFNKISPSTVSNTLKKLHLMGLVARREDLENLKTKTFSLTENGRRALGPIKQNQSEILQIIIEELHLTPEESETAANIIRRAITNFDFWMELSNGIGPDKQKDRLKELREKPLKK